MIKKIIALLFTVLISLSPVFANYYYFEAPVNVGSQENNNHYPTSVVGKNSSVLFWQEINEKENKIQINESYTQNGIDWKQKENLFPQVSYKGEVPQVYSAAINSSGKIILALINENQEIKIYSSQDFFETYKVFNYSNTQDGLLAPRVFVNSKNEFILFASKTSGDSFSLVTSRSSDGITWSEKQNIFTQFDDSKVFNPIAPVFSTYGNKDVLVFQVQYTKDNLISIQLYGSLSNDGGKNWQKPVLITDDKSVNSGDLFTNYNNQNASLIFYNDTLSLAWERSLFNSSNSEIFYCELNPNLKIKNKIEQISTNGYCYKPKLFLYNNCINLLWFTFLGNNRKIFLTTKEGAWWNDIETISTEGSSLPCYMICSNKLSFAWEQYSSNNKKTQIVLLNSDNSTKTPKVSGVSFKNGDRKAEKKVQIRVNVLDDSSGVKGYSWLWTQDANKVPEKQIKNLSDEKTVSVEATKDGVWYFKAIQNDYAGNWSNAAEIAYNLDTTPPEKVHFLDYDIDDYELPYSNSIKLSWVPDSVDKDIAGYTYSLVYIDSIPYKLATNSRHPTRLNEDQIYDTVEKLINDNEAALDRDFTVPKQILTKAGYLKLNNIRNGLYMLNVAAIDLVGNIGEIASKEIVFNKYIPVTYINKIETEENSFGDISLSIIGGGFTYDGRIKEIYIDKDGEVPYDYTLKLTSDDYKITSDYTIEDITLTRIKTGEYKIGLFHTDRGLYFTKNTMLSAVEKGTVKNKSRRAIEFIWDAVSKTINVKNSIAIYLLIILIILAVIGIVISIKSLFDTGKDTITAKKEVVALIEGEIMPEEKKKKSQIYKKVGLGLKTKLILFSTALISSVVIIIFVAFGFYTIRNQKITLASSLENQTKVMLESIASGSKIYLPQTTSDDNLSLVDITNQISALKESRYATIIGYPEENDSTLLDSVWATTDKDILEKIDTETVIPGHSRLLIPELEQIHENLENINTEAKESAEELSINIMELTKEALSLVDKTDAESIRRRLEIQNIRNQLTLKLDASLDKISKENSSSIPFYDSQNLDNENTKYIFYRPIIYRHGNEDSYLHGIILVELSTEDILAQITNARNTILKSGISVMVAVLLISFLLTFIISSIIVKPINKLAEHVAMIRDTDDKENLEGKNIVIKTKDEIGLLGDTINEMTKGLVESAIQSKNLVIGKEVQTKFIPLQTDEKGNTLTTGSLVVKGAEFFSYYAGADDLSGDYFDYKQLDRNHFAIIKCDVSGHGVPAALIMVEVATLFLNYFKNWDMKNQKQGTNLAPVVGQINDLLESRGFKGRFAAFTLCIFNSESGECWFCNAGDNQVQIFDSQLQKKKTVTLQETPAAGMFSTDLIEMKGGYKVSRLNLKKDDVLFLYTDGIEEAKRNFRDENYNLINCSVEGLKDGDVHETHQVGENNEEMGSDRVSKIIEAVYKRQVYSLTKYHNPEQIDHLDFDFTSCDGTAEEAVMALVSVEKIFRMYKPKEIKITNKVKVDKKIDTFLRKHFAQYSTYCRDKDEIETDATHYYYKGVLEDAQYDDLTLIAVKKL